MIKEVVKLWYENKEDLKEALKYDTRLNECDYLYLVKKVVRHILGDEWDEKKITQIDNGDYQGTLLFVIPRETYQPSEYEYLITYVNYGSCSGCDTLLAIQDWNDEPPTERQLEDYMTLCLHLCQNMKKPYKGWIDKDWDVEVEENRFFRKQVDE